VPSEEASLITGCVERRSQPPRRRIIGGRKGNCEHTATVSLADEQDAARLTARVLGGEMAIPDHLKLRYLREIVLVEDQRRDPVLRHGLIVTGHPDAGLV